MGWDECCTISGICPNGGPYRIVASEMEGTESRRLAILIHDQLPDSDHSVDIPDRDTLTEILMTALLEFNQAHSGEIFLGEWASKENAIGIGQFPRHLPYPRPTDYPNTRDIQTIIVDPGSQDSGIFYKVDNSDREIIRRVYCSSTYFLGNFFVLQRSLKHLKAWLDYESFQPRSVVFPLETEPLPIEMELYEIVNFSTESRPQRGLLQNIDYQGIQLGVQWQQCYLDYLDSCKNTVKALKNGIRGKDLIWHVLEDCNWWIWARPDVWPNPPQTNGSPDLLLRAEPPVLDFKNLPLEIFQMILDRLPFKSIILLASTCHNLYDTIMHSINPLLRRRINSPQFDDISLRWILPLEGESEAAIQAYKAWCPVADDPNLSPPTSAALFDNPSFPYLSFMRAVYTSNPMKSRERIWKMVKQFDALWRKYRAGGPVLQASSSV